MQHAGILLRGPASAARVRVRRRLIRVRRCREQGLRSPSLRKPRSLTGSAAGISSCAERRGTGTPVLRSRCMSRVELFKGGGPSYRSPPRVIIAMNQANTLVELAYLGLGEQEVRAL